MKQLCHKLENTKQAACFRYFYFILRFSFVQVRGCPLWFIFLRQHASVSRNCCVEVCSQTTSIPSLTLVSRSAGKTSFQQPPSFQTAPVVCSVGRHSRGAPALMIPASPERGRDVPSLWTGWHKPRLLWEVAAAGLVSSAPSARGDAAVWGETGQLPGRWIALGIN